MQLVTAALMRDTAAPARITAEQGASLASGNVPGAPSTSGRISSAEHMPISRTGRLDLLVGWIDSTETGILGFNSLGIIVGCADFM